MRRFNRDRKSNKLTDTDTLTARHTEGDVLQHLGTALRSHYHQRSSRFTEVRYSPSSKKQTGLGHVGCHLTANTQEAERPL